MQEDMPHKTIRFLTGSGNLFIVCCDWTDSGSLFHSMGKAIVKPRLPMAFLGQTEERDSRFPWMRLLVLIKDDKYVIMDLKELSRLNIQDETHVKIC